MKILFLLLFSSSAFLTGCAGLSRALIDVTGAGVGATVGHFASHGNPGWTVGGAVAGAGLGEAVQLYKSRAEASALRTGIDLGRSDSVKEMYWIQQKLQQSRSGAPGTTVTLYPIPIPEQEIDGVKLQPTTRLLRIHQ